MPVITLLALVQAVYAAPPPARERPVQSAPTAMKHASLLHDTRGRPVMTVAINNGVPVPMVVDTAAQTSLIAADLAKDLDLKPLPGGIRVNGATGSEQARLYGIDRLSSPLFEASDVAIVELTNGGVTDARGIIGMEHFTNGRLTIDRSARQIAVSRSGIADAGYATVKGSRTDEGFVTVPMTLDGVQVPGLIDTGSAVTVVNLAAFRLLGWSDADPRLADGGEIRGASAGGQRIRTAKISKLAIGRITLSNVSVMIADDAGQSPSITLGSDLLNRFPGYAVDFPRGELQIKLPGKSTPDDQAGK